jgi:hypothetical protein
MPICIITPTGIICEATSYYRHYYTADDKPGGEMADSRDHPSSFRDRVLMLMEIADIQEPPFTIVSRPEAPK